MQFNISLQVQVVLEIVGINMSGLQLNYVSILLFVLITFVSLQTVVSQGLDNANSVSSLQKEINESLKALEEAIKNLNAKLSAVTALKLQLEEANAKSPPELSTEAPTSLPDSTPIPTQPSQTSPSSVDETSSSSSLQDPPPSEVSTPVQITAKINLDATTNSNGIDDSPTTPTFPLTGDTEENKSTTIQSATSESSTTPQSDQADSSPVPSPSDSKQDDLSSPPDQNDNAQSEAFDDYPDPLEQNQSEELPPVEPATSPDSNASSPQPTETVAELPSPSTPSISPVPIATSTEIPPPPPSSSPPSSVPPSTLPSQINRNLKKPPSGYPSDEESSNPPAKADNVDTNNCQNSNPSIVPAVPYSVTKYKPRGTVSGILIEFGNLPGPANYKNAQEYNEVNPSSFLDQKQFECILRDILTKAGMLRPNSNLTQQSQPPLNPLNLNLNNVNYNNDIFSNLGPTANSELKGLQVKGGRCMKSSPLPKSLESLSMQNVAMPTYPNPGATNQAISNCPKLRRLQCSNIQSPFSMAQMPSQSLQSISMTNTPINYAPNVAFPRCSQMQMQYNNPNQLGRGIAPSMNRIFPNLQNAMINGNNSAMIDSTFQIPNLKRLCFPMNYAPGTFQNPVLNNAVQSCGNDQQSQGDVCQLRKNREKRWVADVMSANEVQRRGQYQDFWKYDEVRRRNGPIRPQPPLRSVWVQPSIVFEGNYQNWPRYYKP